MLGSYTRSDSQTRTRFDDRAQQRLSWVLDSSTRESDVVVLKFVVTVLQDYFPRFGFYPAHGMSLTNIVYLNHIFYGSNTDHGHSFA